ncbi:MAG: VOC family protein [Candidatus Paracaedibacteraceae bacterium]|nr:VOC family protein [Candidatus Paracaedibacteraceae bacterium]
MSIFHLAIPSHDLTASKEFYTKAFGATVGREYPHYVIFNFFGHQVVTHHDPKGISETVKMYPRHYGIIFTNRDDFDTIYQLCKEAEAPFFEELFERYQNKKGWHFSFFVSDPSNNLIELKYYVNQDDIFN